MTELVSHVAAFVIGAAAATIFMTALWKSVRDLGRDRHVTRQWIAGGVLRHGMLYLAFYAALALGDWSHLLGALLGFILVRSLAIVSFGQLRVQEARREPI